MWGALIAPHHGGRYTPRADSTLYSTYVTIKRPLMHVGILMKAILSYCHDMIITDEIFYYYHHNIQFIII